MFNVYISERIRTGFISNDKQRNVLMPNMQCAKDFSTFEDADSFARMNGYYCWFIIGSLLK